MAAVASIATVSQAAMMVILLYTQLTPSQADTNPSYARLLPTATSNTSNIPSYTTLMSTAEAVLRATKDGALNSSAADFKKSWPLLFSPTLFQHGVVEAAEHLMQSGALHAGLSANYSVSAKCIEHMEEILLGLIDRQGWAVQMLDAMGKPPPNLEGLNLLWPGSLKECHKVLAVNTTSNHTMFNGKYCTATVPFSKPSAVNPFGATLATGVCVPDSCSTMDVSILLNIVVYELKLPLPQYPYATCPDPEQSYDGLAISAFVVIGVFVLLMMVGTVLDLWYKQLPKWRAETMVNFSGNHDDDDVPLLGPLTVKVPEPGFVVRLLIAFSVYTNGAKLLSTEQPAGNLSCVHGVRFLSMTWVVLGHCYFIPLFASVNLVPYITEIIKRWTFQAIINATVSVDSFFVLSGLLVAYLSLREMKRVGGALKVNWVKFYFHRFWRLTPPYMLIIFVYTALLPYMGSGPMWPGQRDPNCQDNWWTNLLYVNNFVHPDKMCVGQSWYLANDMQFYILSPLIFIPLYYSPVVGGVSALLFLLASTITSGVLSTVNHYGPAGNQNGISETIVAGANYQTDFYVKPYTRMGPYVIGMLTGYLLYRTDCKAKINRVVNLLCWSVATAAALTVLYGLYHCYQGHTMSLSVAALYNATFRSVWSVALAWVIFACVTGNGGYVNTILSWKALIPLSRLTYCIYLLHIAMLYIYGLSRDTPFYFSDANVVMLFLGALVACYLVSIVVSLAFEVPMMALEKVILSPRRLE